MNAHNALITRQLTIINDINAKLRAGGNQYGPLTAAAIDILQHRYQRAADTLLLHEVPAPALYGVEPAAPAPQPEQTLDDLIEKMAADPELLKSIAGAVTKARAKAKAAAKKKAA